MCVGRAFSVIAPKLWNSMPLEANLAPSLPTGFPLMTGCLREFFFNWMSVNVLVLILLTILLWYL